MRLYHPTEHSLFLWAIVMQITPFNFDSNEVRVIDGEGEPLFVARDVAEALGYSNARDAISRHCRDVVKRDIPSGSGTQSYSMIREPDVYRLVMKSKLPSAERFESWVFNEVLPAIRKTGAYAVKPARPASSLDALQAMVDTLKQQEERVHALESQVDAITRGEAFYTVVGYANKRSERLDATRTRAIGKVAAKMCRREGIEMGVAPHPLYGDVKTYPSEILDLAFDLA